LPELINGDAPRFIILTFATAMMHTIGVQLSYIERLGLSKLPLCPPLGKFNMFDLGIIAFICYLVSLILALTNIFFQIHLFDLPIISLLLVGAAFEISWIVWVIAAKKNTNNGTIPSPKSVL
jgi:hypothetical protein